MNRKKEWNGRNGRKECVEVMEGRNGREEWKE